MTWFEATILGLVQGLTEFLPISSSAHIRIVAAIGGWDDPGAAFTAVTQLGTELAVLLYFRRDIARIVTGWLRVLLRQGRGPDDQAAARLGWFVILGTVPIAVLGLLFQSAIEHQFRHLWLIALTLVAFGLLLGFADRVATSTRSLDQLGRRDALLLGLAQACALVPGVSRSGGTITAGLLLGFTRTDAARYSFLLALPAVLASGGLEATKIHGGSVSWGPTILATAIAFAVGFAVIAWLMRFLTTHSFRPFVLYRVVLGLGVLLAVATTTLN